MIFILNDAIHPKRYCNLRSVVLCFIPEFQFLLRFTPSIAKLRNICLCAVRVRCEECVFAARH